jgi:hypothetical protein
MKKILSSILAAVTMASSLVIAAPADARNRDVIIKQGQGFHATQGRRNFVNRRAYAGRNYGWNQGRGYGQRGYGWRGGRYRGYDNYDNGDAIGAGVAGLAAGVIISGVLSRSRATPGSCAARFQSYNRATGTYLGYDGLRHSCP